MDPGTGTGTNGWEWAGDEDDLYSIPYGPCNHYLRLATQASHKYVS